MKYIILFFIPVIVLAAPQTFKDLLFTFSDIVNLATPIVASASLLVFFWGLAKFIFFLGGDADIEHGRQLMIWGIIALFVMFSVWGIVKLFASYVDAPLGVPQLPEIDYLLE